MKILITGGFGFVGGRLAQYLNGKGHTIILGSRNNQKSPSWCPGAEIVVTNWDEYESLTKTCDGVECIIHAAGMNAQDCAANPAEAIIVNGLNTTHLLQAAIKSGVQKFIYLSTAHVFASELKGTISEDTCPRNLHPYATSHRIGENSVLAANLRNEIGGTVFRLSNAFGMPTHKGVNVWYLLVNDICRQAVLNQKIVLRSGGNQYRDFIGMDAVTQTIGKSLELGFHDQNYALFNLGSGRTMSILEMAELVSSRYEVLFNKKVLVEREINDTSNFERMDYSIDKIKAQNLFFQSDFNLEIDSLLRFCKSNFSLV